MPSFGGPLDEDELRPPALDPRLARLRVRAMLVANPGTPCSTEEVAAVFGLRQGSVRDARPATAQRIGRALVAPFGHWLRALERAGLVPRWEEDLPDGEPVEIGPLRASTMKRWRETEAGTQWYWRARRKGVRDDVWSGWGTRAYAQERLAELVAGGVPVPRRREAAVEVRTMGDLLDLWVDRQRERPDLRPATVDHYEKCGRHLFAWLRDVDLRRVDRDTLERFRDDRLREGASRRLVVQELKILSMAWRWGQECNHAPTRLLPRVLVQVDDSAFVINHRTPTVGEVAEVLSRLKGDAGLAVRLLAVTGARVSEVCNLAPDALDLRSGTLHLDGKTGQRSFPLPADLVEALRDRIGDDRELDGPQRRGDAPLLPAGLRRGPPPGGGRRRTRTLPVRGRGDRGALGCDVGYGDGEMSEAEPMPKNLLPDDYPGLLDALKSRIAQERVRVVMAANAAMVLLYWDIGRAIGERQEVAGWGARVIERLSADLRRAFPDMRGLSVRNLRYMRAFAAA